jgi:hypothetical protein
MISVDNEKDCQSYATTGRRVQFKLPRIGQFILLKCVQVIIVVPLYRSFSSDRFSTVLRPMTYVSEHKIQYFELTMGRWRDAYVQM